MNDQSDRMRAAQAYVLRLAAQTFTEHVRRDPLTMSDPAARALLRATGWLRQLAGALDVGGETTPRLLALPPKRDLDVRDGFDMAVDGVALAISKLVEDRDNPRRFRDISELARTGAQLARLAQHHRPLRVEDYLAAEGHVCRTADMGGWDAGEPDGEEDEDEDGDAEALPNEEHLPNEASIVDRVVAAHEQVRDVRDRAEDLHVRADEESNVAIQDVLEGIRRNRMEEARQIRNVNPPFPPRGRPRIPAGDPLRWTYDDMIAAAGPVDTQARPWVGAPRLPDEEPTLPPIPTMLGMLRGMFEQQSEERSERRAKDARRDAMLELRSLMESRAHATDEDERRWFQGRISAVRRFIEGLGTADESPSYASSVDAPARSEPPSAEPPPPAEMSSEVVCTQCNHGHGPYWSRGSMGATLDCDICGAPTVRATTDAQAQGESAPCP